MRALHRVRESLIRDKVKTTNQMHAFLLEFGTSMPIGTAVIKRLSVVLAEHELPPYLVQLLMRLHGHDGDIAWWRRYFSRDPWPFAGSGTSKRG